MTWDQSVLIIVWVVFITLALALLIRVEWRDWGLVGLLVLVAAITALVTLSNLNQWMDGDASAVPGSQTMIWSWRYGAAAGGVVVLTGLLIEFHRNPPPRDRVVRRLALGLAVFVVIFLGFWWAS